MSGPHRNPDRINTIGVVVVGICGAVLVYVTIVALEAFYVNDTSEIQTMADYGGQDTTAKSVRADQVQHINEYGPNSAVVGAPQTYRIKIDDAMKLVTDAAKVDPSQLIPAVGRSDVSTIKPVFGRPKIEPPPPAPPAGAGSAAPPGTGSGSAAQPPAGAGSAAIPPDAGSAAAAGAGNKEVECPKRECGPRLGMPNRKCPDGSTAGPTDRCLRHPDGKCGWEVLQCPAAAVIQPVQAPMTPTGTANPKQEPSPVAGSGPTTQPGAVKPPAKPGAGTPPKQPTTTPKQPATTPKPPAPQPKAGSGSEDMHRNGIVAIVAAALVAGATQAQAHPGADTNAASDEAVLPPPPTYKGNGVVVDEHVGARIPLDVKFRTADGMIVTLADVMRGELPVILTFNYSDCPMLCSVQLNGLTTALPAIATVGPGPDPAKGDVGFRVGAQYRIVTIDLEPNEPLDKIQKLRERYLNRFAEADRERARAGWTFLLAAVPGDDAAIRRVADAVGFRYTYLPARAEYAHPAALIFLSASGVVTRYVYGIEFDPKMMRESIYKAGLAEPATAVGFMNRCYHFDPDEESHAHAAVLALRLGAAGFVVLLLSIFGVMHVIRRSKRPGVIRS